MNWKYVAKEAGKVIAVMLAIPLTVAVVLAVDLLAGC